MGDLSLLPHLFIQPFIYTRVWTHGHLLYTLVYNPILLCFAAQLVLTLTTGSSLGWPHVPLTNSINVGFRSAFLTSSPSNSGAGDLRATW